MNAPPTRFSVVILSALMAVPVVYGQGTPPAAVPPAPPKPRPVVAADPPFAMFKVPLPMIQRSVLNGVEGRINQMGVDVRNNRLFVAAKGKNSVEVLELPTNKQLTPLADLPEPSGVLVLSDLRKLVVSCGGDGSVRTFTLSDAGDATAEKTVKFEGEVDAIRFDAGSGRMYVGHGRKLGSFKLDTGERGPSLDLGAMPEGFSLDPNSDRVYVNLQANGTVAVLKRDKATGALTLEATWAINGAKGNYAGAFDPATGHYFAVCRNPAKLVVLDTKTGTQVAALECIDDTDGAWWDPVLRRVFVSGGGSGGRVDVFQQGAASEAGKPADYKLFHKETTNVGARTSVLVPEQRRFIVAAPKIGADPTFLYVYLIGP